MISQQDKKAVLVPIIFFSWFKYPLNLVELRRYLWHRDLTEIEIIQIIKLLPKVHFRDGLVWRGNWVPERIGQQELSKQIWAKITKWRWLFCWVPFLREVYITNTLAYDNIHPNSDIDLLIVGEKGRLWTMRAILLVILNIFRLRVRSIDRFAKFSPEFFVSTGAISISNLAIANDYYLSYWLADLTPIWPDGEHRQFRQVNAWFRDNLPLAWLKPKLKRYRYLHRNAVVKLLEKFLSGKQGSRLEDWLYTKQRRVVELNLRRLSINPEVVTNRDIIKLHFNDRRAGVRDAIEQALNELSTKAK